MKKEVNLIKNLGKIKRIKRSGWVREGINNPESVADHSYRVAAMHIKEPLLIEILEEVKSQRISK